MTQLTPDVQSEALGALPHLPRDESGPVFAEPWQAQAFALVVHLHGKGAFTWQEWASALSDEIKHAAARGERWSRRRRTAATARTWRPRSFSSSAQWLRCGLRRALVAVGIALPVFGVSLLVLWPLSRKR